MTDLYKEYRNIKTQYLTLKNNQHGGGKWDDIKGDLKKNLNTCIKILKIVTDNSAGDLKDNQEAVAWLNNRTNIENLKKWDSQVVNHENSGSVASLMEIFRDYVTTGEIEGSLWIDKNYRLEAGFTPVRINPQNLPAAEWFSEFQLRNVARKVSRGIDFQSGNLSHKIHSLDSLLGHSSLLKVKSVTRRGVDIDKNIKVIDIKVDNFCKNMMFCTLPPHRRTY